MPLFKFKKSTKKVPMKSSSMGNLYKDYGDNREFMTAADSAVDKRSSWENCVVADHHHDVATVAAAADKRLVADLQAQVEAQAAQLEALKKKVEKQEVLLRESQQEKNLLLLKTEVLIDMVSYKTAENQSLAMNNAKLKAYVEKKLHKLKCATE